MRSRLHYKVLIAGKLQGILQNPAIHRNFRV
jgi:hypothetical protein